MNEYPLNAELVTEEAGASVRRLFPTLKLRTLDPFVVLDELKMQPGAELEGSSGRGFEALTYVLDGQLACDDWTIPAGGAQRLVCGPETFGPGMPHGASSHHGLSLWLNVPERLANVEAQAQSVEPALLPLEQRDGLSIRTIAGEGSPMQVMTPMRWLDIEMAADARHQESVPAGWNGLVYVIHGSVSVGGEVLGAGAASFPLDLTDGSRGFDLHALEASRVTVIAGRPHKTAALS